jgi:hypothetical protein
MTTRIGTEQLEEYLLQLLREFSAPRTMPVSTPTAPRTAPAPLPTQAPAPAPVPVHTTVPGPAPTPTPGLNQNAQDRTLLIYTIRDIMLDYNQNFHEYQENTRRFIQLIGDINTPPVEQRYSMPSARQAPPPPPQRESTLFSTIRAFLPNLQATRFSDVIVSPSTRDIRNATRSVIYSVNAQFNNTRCPITLEDFIEQEIVTQIRHCGHCFKPSAIQNWFRTNVRCPVCRFDIRETVVNELNNQNDDDNDSTEEDTANSNESNYSNLLGSPVFTVEFPISSWSFPLTSTELSGNDV